jgi:hypothetical protein
MPSDPSPADGVGWRPVVAALANAQARRVFAEIELGTPLDAVGSGLSPSRRERALEVLTRAGLVVVADGVATVAAGRLTSALRDAPARPPRTGIDRFLDAEGRIDRYPSSAADRDALLGHVAQAVLESGEVVDEAELGDRLRRFADDTALLRRHLVDAGLLHRTPTGSAYSRHGMD